MQIGHLDAACATWHQALDDYSTIQSGRADERLTTMLALIRPHLRNPAAHSLHEGAQALEASPLPKV